MAATSLRVALGASRWAERVNQMLSAHRRRGIGAPKPEPEDVIGTEPN